MRRPSWGRGTGGAWGFRHAGRFDSGRPLYRLHFDREAHRMAKEKRRSNGTPESAFGKEESFEEFDSAIDKIRDAMACSKSEQIQLLGEGLTALLQLHPELEDKILQKEKTLDGALGAVRKNAVGGCSDPVRTTKSLCEYFGIECKNPHALALEVTVAMMGGEAAAGNSPAPAGAPSTKGRAEEKPADPFDLDALMGVL